MKSNLRRLLNYLSLVFLIMINSCSDDNITCLLYTSDAADERSSVDLGGRRIIKKKKIIH